MNNTFQIFRAALLSVALVTISSTAAFGQLQSPKEPEVGIEVKNAVAFEMYCNGTGCNPPAAYNGSAFVIPSGYRLVINHISIMGSVPYQSFFQLVGSLNRQTARHVFPFGPANGNAGFSVASYHCFLVIDSIANGTGFAAGSGTIYFSGYLAKI